MSLMLLMPPISIKLSPAEQESEKIYSCLLGTTDIQQRSCMHRDNVHGSSNINSSSRHFNCPGKFANIDFFSWVPQLAPFLSCSLLCPESTVITPICYLAFIIYIGFKLSLKYHKLFLLE